MQRLSIARDYALYHLGSVRQDAAAALCRQGVQPTGRWVPPRAVSVALPEEQRYPEFGQCVHKVAQDAENPERLYLQNHNGVYRSDDWGGKWVSIAEGLPGEFGFAIVADPNRGGHAYVFPLVSDYSRFTPEFRCRVYGTTDAG